MAHWPSEGIRPVNMDILITLLIVASVLGALASNRVPADITMMAALVLVLVTGVVSVSYTHLTLPTICSV